MNEKERLRNGCRYCKRAFKNYTCIGFKQFYRGAFACYKSPTEVVKGVDFEEKATCEQFEPDRMHEPKNDTQQMIAYLSRQIDDVMGLLDDILDILYPDEDDDNAQKCAENNHDDE